MNLTNWNRKKAAMLFRRNSPVNRFKGGYRVIGVFYGLGLRHEAISRFFEMGLSVPEVALISGHRDPRMLLRYTHLRAEEVGKKLI